MQQKSKNVLFISACCISSFLFFSGASADHDHGHDKHESKNLPMVTNETYRQECGACHFVYQPGLLPAGSWEKILNQLPSHSGEELVEIEQEAMTVIADYLQSNAAEHASAERAAKILRSLNGEKPLRITEIPYIQEKHSKLQQNIFSRQSIGSRANCPACHTSAERGVYEDDLVKIPK
jgi:hypothetical protein